MSVRRQLVYLGLLLATIATVDFARRIHVGRDDALRAYATPAIAPLPAPRDVAMVKRRLGAWLPAFVGGDGAAANDPGAWELRLAGTFQQQGRPFVVIMATQKGARGKPQAHRLTVGETVNGRTVTEIRPGAVLLQSPAGVEELTVFKRAERPGA